MNGWLVNDYLTTMAGTKTWWHYMLEWFSLKDMCLGDYSILPDEIEQRALQEMPDFIIRNASYFRPLNLPVKTISLLQDIASNPMQNSVLTNSDIVVTNSIFTREHYPDISNEKLRIIPLGIDFNLFRPLENKEELRHKWNIRENSVCFIGAAFDIKGWNLLRHVMEKSPHINFVLVMKDYYNLETANMRVFNKVPHSDLVEIINCCKAGICTSEKETQHLAGLEMGACGVPIITSDVGVYYKREPGEWGFRYGDPIGDLNKILSLDLNPRDYWLKEGYDLETCRKAWQNVINEL